MSVSAPAQPRPTFRVAIVVPAFVVVVPLIIGLALPLILARPAHLTSDESLYQAEAYNIAHGKGFTYPSGEPITHRAPLYPLVLAPAIKLAGPHGAYAVTKLVVILNALLVTWLAWRCAGAIAGAVGGVAAASSAYLNGLGTTLYLDPFQCLFLLAAVAALLESARHPSARWFAAAGLATGVAFLAKESAVQWAPLGLVAWLAAPSLSSHAGARGAMLFLLALGVIVAPWYAFVWLHTGDLYLIGNVSTNVMIAGLVVALGVLAYSVALVAWPSLPAAARRSARSFAAPAAAAIVATWGAAMLYALTVHASWPYPNDYLVTVPRYLGSVAPAAQPYFLLLAAWVWTGVRSFRGDSTARLLCVAAALFAPFALFAANRNLQLRDALPLVYLSYVVLGIAVAAVVAWLRKSVQTPFGEAVVFVGLAAACGGFAVQQLTRFDGGSRESASVDVRADSWDSTLVRETAEWMDANLPPGSRVLSNRLYFSSLHVRTNARFEIRQMPTVRVAVEPDRHEPVRPASNLFRWGDGELRAGSPTDTWLWLRRFPGKGYWVGLSQREFLQYTQQHEIDYVVLTGDDGIFSSLHFAWFLSSHPAFKLIHQEDASPSDQVFVYSVDRTRLAALPHSTAITPSDADALQALTRMDLRQIADALGTPVRVTDGDRGLSQRELYGAVAGIDLAGR